MRQTDINKKLLLEALEKTLGNFTQASKLVGIHRTTLHRYYNNDSRFRAKVDDLQHMKKDFIESKLMSLVTKENPAAVIFCAKTQLQDRGYIEKTQIQLTDPDPIRIVLDTQDQVDKLNKLLTG